MQLRDRTVFVASLALALLLTASAVGQETRATLSGTITDPSGAAVAGAKLHLVNADTGVDFTAESNVVGQYRFLFLNPGTYRVSAEMSGFRTFVREKIV
ncbi:MAG: carboxypeptidase-like regulatory domain-containing protein [Acidobacteria bacterium]|nr:carboxypeptidase-like regulatory domain-containing protein [Acidobacteriota bacterium]